MEVLDDDCIFIDVDETLLLPASSECFVPQDINKPLIEKIKQWNDEGRTIIVWTSNPDGVEHCKKAIDKCGLQKHVHYVMPKPITIVDDDHLEYYNIIDPISLKQRESSNKVKPTYKISRLRRDCCDISDPEKVYDIDGINVMFECQSCGTQTKTFKVLPDGVSKAIDAWNSQTL